MRRRRRRPGEGKWGCAVPRTARWEPHFGLVKKGRNLLYGDPGLRRDDEIGPGLPKEEEAA